MSRAPAPPAGVRQVRERPAHARVPVHEHPDWAARFPWLVQGTTGRGARARPFDLGLWGEQPVGDALRRWRELRESLGMGSAVHALQVHGVRVEVHETEPSPGLLVLDDADGHATRAAGLLLAVSIADCVPVFLVDPALRAVAVLHAGWRGVAARILAVGVATLSERWGSDPGELHVHLGPAICGECYEVGPEVHEAIGLARPRSASPVDLRAALARQARDVGLATERITMSAYCTGHDEGFFSHRGGDRARQMAVIGVRS